MQHLKPDSRVFCKMDATQGYFQIPLDEASSKLTTFLLPSGRFRYLRAPMGLNASSDEWCFSSDQIVHGLPYAQKIVDDILIEAPSLKVLYVRIRAILKKCEDMRVTISKKKLKIGSTIEFAGFLVSGDGVRPDPEKVICLKEFPRPHDLTSLRSFLGLANQLGHFIPDLSHMTIRLRELLKGSTAWLWLPEHESDFKKIKMLLSSSLLVKPFDPCLQTELLTDASRNFGIGFMLLQRGKNNQLRIVRCGSRSLTAAQKNYAVIDLECLAIVWAIQKCRFYLHGMPNFKVITDHRPLLGIFDKPLHELPNQRLMKFRELLTDYSFELLWQPGKQHLIADALSRSPVFPPECDSTERVFSNLCLKVAKDPAQQLLFDAIDDEYMNIIEAFRQNIPRQLPVTHPARDYISLWDAMSLLDNEPKTLLLLHGDRIIVPKSARHSILLRLHTSHQGLVKTKLLANKLYFWPGMNSDIKNMIEACDACQKLRPSLGHEPLSPREPAIFPMQEVSVDLFEYAGKHYITMVDRYSGYIFVDLLSNLSSDHVIKILRHWFLLFGFPKTIVSDNGPQFRSDFGRFCSSFGAFHVTSSPYFPQSNGLAESAVKSAKHLLIKCLETDKDFQFALSEFRRVPRQDKYSPAQLMFGYQQRGILPSLNHPLVDLKEAESARQKIRDSQKKTFDAGSHVLQPISIGTKVLVQHPISKRWDRKAVILSILESGRSYEIKYSDGKLTRRNRRFLRPMSYADVAKDITHESISSPSQKSILKSPDYVVSAALRRSSHLKDKKSVHYAV